MRNSTSNKGFTLIELLIVIAIIGILAAVLIPNLLNARSRANDVSAEAVARQVATAAVAVQVNNPANVNPTCAYNAAAGNTLVSSGSETTTVASPAPVTGVTCAIDATTDALTVTVTYNGGSANDTTVVVDL